LTVRLGYIASLTLLALPLAACEKADLAATDRVSAFLTGSASNVVPAPVIDEPIIVPLALDDAPAAPVIEPVVAVPVVVEPEPCVSIFRIQTCEEGVLHHLGPQMEWLD
jgi:hypothetical protein